MWLQVIAVALPVFKSYEDVFMQSSLACVEPLLIYYFCIHLYVLQSTLLEFAGLGVKKAFSCPLQGMNVSAVK